MLAAHGALGTVAKVYVDYFDGAGIENLAVNGGPLHVDEFELMPNAIAPGIALTVYEYAGPGFRHGTPSIRMSPSLMRSVSPGSPTSRLM